MSLHSPEAYANPQSESLPWHTRLSQYVEQKLGLEDPEVQQQLAQQQETTALEIQNAVPPSPPSPNTPKEYVVIQSSENLRRLDGTKDRVAKKGERFQILDDLPPKGRYHYKRVCGPDGKEYKLCINDGERTTIKNEAAIREIETQERNELISNTPLHPVEEVILQNSKELGNSLPDIIRIMPALQSGEFSRIEEALSKSPNVHTLLTKLRSTLLTNPPLRSNLFQALIIQIDKSDKSAAEKDALKQMLAKPEQQQKLVEFFCDPENIPRILNGSGKEGFLDRVSVTLFKFDQGTEIEGLYSNSTDLIVDGLVDWVKEGYADSKRWVKTKLNSLLGTNFDISSKEETESIPVPDLLANPKNAEKFAQFFDQNKALLEAAGEDVPILYLGIKAILNQDFENPAISKLSQNQSLQKILDALHQFIVHDPELKAQIIQKSQEGIRNVLQSADKTVTADWEAIDQELTALINGNQDLQNQFLDFAFLKFDKGILLQAAQGKASPLKAGKAILQIPFVKNLTQALASDQKAPHLKNVIAQIGINAGFRKANEKMNSDPEWPKIQHQLRTLAENPEIQKSVFRLLSEENTDQLLTSLEDFQNGKSMRAGKKLLRNTEIRNILAQVSQHLQKKDAAPLKKRIISSALDQVQKSTRLFQTSKGRALFQKARPHLQKALTTSPIVSQVLNLGASQEGEKVLSKIRANKRNPEALVNTIRRSPQTQAIIKEASRILQKDSSIRNLCLDSIKAKNRKLKPLTNFLKRNPRQFNNLLGLAENTDQLQRIARTITPLTKKRNPSPQEIIATADKLIQNPKIKSLVKALVADRKTFRDGVDQVLPIAQKKLEKALTGVLDKEGLQKSKAALRAMGQIIKSDREIQNLIGDIIQSPAQLKPILNTKGNPGALIKALGNNPKLVQLIDRARTKFLASPEVKAALVTTTDQYLSSLNRPSAKRDRLSTPPAQKPGNEILRSLQQTPRLKSVYDKTIDQIGQDDWKEARGQLFEKGSKRTLQIVRKKALGDWNIDGKKWAQIEGRIARFMGQNQEIQRSMLALGKDFSAINDLMNLTNPAHQKVLRNPHVRTIFKQIDKFFTQDRKTWELTKNTLFDAAIEKYLPPDKQHKKEALRKVIVPALVPGRTINPNTLQSILDDIQDMKGSGSIRKGFNALQINSTLGISNLRLMFAYLLG